MPFQNPSGFTDAYFIARVRRNIKDQGVMFQEPFTTDGVKGAITVAGSAPFRFKRSPIVASGAVCTLNAVAQVVDYDNPAPIAGHVSIVTETGEFFFSAPPATSLPIAFSYKAYRFSDQQILDALTDGLADMWPKIWQPKDDSSIIFAPTVTEYTLPNVFNSTRVKIISVEAQPPFGILVSIPTGSWRRVGNTTLIINRMWPAGTTLRITYNAQYQTLSDLEGEVHHLPVYYATAKLLLDQETTRSRAGDIQQLAGEGANPPATASNVAQLWEAKYEKLKANLAVEPPTRSSVPDRSVEGVLVTQNFEWNPV